MRPVLAIDMGRYATKWVGIDRSGSFPSVVGEHRPLRISNGGDYDVKIEGMGHFFVGELANESHSRRRMATSSKLHPETKTFFLTALALCGVETNPLIVTGLPVDQHTPEIKQGMRDLLSGAHEVTINGIRHNFTVQPDQLLFAVEGGGAYWDETVTNTLLVADEKLAQHPKVRIIDLGSRTVNYVTIASGNYIDRESGTLDYGCFELETTGARDFARRVFADLTQRLSDLKPAEDLFLLTGGGVMFVADVLQEYFEHVRAVTRPGMANVLGYRKLGLEHVSSQGNRL